MTSRVRTCCAVCMQAAVEVRKQVNQLDNLTTSKAVDALLNAETVALFGNRQLEVRGLTGTTRSAWAQHITAHAMSRTTCAACLDCTHLCHASYADPILPCVTAAGEPV